MNKQDLSYFGNDPGAVKYGNFINYYSFHSPEERLKNFNCEMFPAQFQGETLICLDIGCNSGELTIQMYIYLTIIFPGKDIFMLGIDIDPTLIERAKENNNIKNITFLCMDIMPLEEQKKINLYLEPFHKKKFDCTFCFSVTMWIHLNNGDNGLIEFLILLEKISKTIIIEPQPWKCYKTALKRIRKGGSDFPLLKIIEIKENVENVIEKTLLQLNLKKIYESPLSKWNRKILSFHKSTEKNDF